MATEEFKERFFKTVGEAYGDSFPESYEEAKRHVAGDTLADFICSELVDGIDWDECDERQIAERATELMRRAQADIEFVIIALESLQKNA